MKYKSKKQRGIALILTLGVLSILLAIGVAFISSTIIARKTAAANSGRSVARFLAKSGMGHLLANIMLHQMEDVSLSDFTVAHSRQPGTETVNTGTGKTDGIAAGEASNLLKVFVDNNFYEPSTIRQPEWIYLYNDTESSRPIIGRYAYMILPLPGQINFSEVLRGKKNGNWNNRLGATMRELAIGVRDFPTFDGNLQNVINGWADSSVDFTDLPAALSSYLSVANLNWILNNFAPGGYSEPENYAYDPVADVAGGKLSDTVLYYHRFNLARTDWNSLGGTGANSKEAVDLLLGDGNFAIAQFKGDDTVSPTSSGVQFLRMIGSDAGAYPDRETRRRQIAANLIDYCDTDSIPTSDSTDWWTTPPSYTGNDKTPYLNEVGVGLTLAVVRLDEEGDPAAIPAEPAKATIEGEVSVSDLLLELVNIYDEDLNADAIQIKGSVSLEVLDGNNALIDSFQDNFDFSGTLSPTLVAAESYQSWKLSMSPSPFDFRIPDIESPGQQWVDDNDPRCQIRVVVKELRIEKVYLSHSGNPVDFARDLSGSLSANHEMSLHPARAATLQPVHLAVAFSVDDPRENLYQGAGGYENWKIFTSGEIAAADYAFPALSNAGDVTLVESGQSPHNRNFSPGGVGDPDAGTGGPWDISTAYIRNEPMKSPVELGAIHRGAKWETINLKSATSAFSHVMKYDPGFSLNDAGSAYADGDGGILDQIKMTDKLYDSAKLNLNNRPTAANTDIRDLYAALWYNVRVAGLELSDLPGTGSLISDTDAIQMAQEMHVRTSTADLLSRAEALYGGFAAGTAAFSNGFGVVPGSTDIQQEALIGKTVCLLTSRQPPPSYIQAVVIAQAIKDVGDIDSMIKYDKTGNPVNYANLQTRQFDFQSIGTFPNVEHVYFDEIIGEIKLLLTIDRDGTTRKLKVIRMEFLD